ncbi:hypothetical protein ATCC90586_011364 [Pythium insidiosum]|nr:hypothetical protein ATCC90586_011364 [Pythium insidiosum]
MDKIDGQLNTLETTLDTGFTGTGSDIDTVERDTTAALNKLGGTVLDAGAKTREQVKSVIQQATAKTMAHLDNLEDLVESKSNEKLLAIQGLQSLVERSSNELRQNVADELDNRVSQLQSRVASAASYIAGTAEVTANALVSESDALRTELGRRIAFMTKQLEVIDGRISLTQKALQRLDGQVDEILGFMASINTRLTGIFRTLRDLPNRIRQVVMVKSVQDKFRDAERLSFAYANYMKRSMNQLQAFEFLQQCNVVREALLFDSLLERLSRSELVLRRELAAFNDSRVDYEQYGNRIAIAAYHLRYMLLPCGNMRDLEKTGKAVFGEATSRAQADKLNTAIWTFQMNMEETVPRLFLQKVYNAAYLQSSLEDARRSINGSEAFSLPAIETLRFQLQQQVGSFAAVTVINAPQRGLVGVWTKSVSASALGVSRFGLLRVSPRDEELVVVYGATPQQIPRHLLDGFRIPITAADLTTDRLAALFQASAYAPFWAAGLIQSVVFVPRVEKTCPWAVAPNHFPFCWESGSIDDGGGCVCVQIEGLAPTADASAMTTQDGPTPWALKTTISGTGAAPRANFLVAAVDKFPTTLAARTEMLGQPLNRRRFALCMSTPPPARECLTAGGRTLGL